jgi:predicted deacylase
MVGIGSRVQRGQPLFQVCDPVSDKVTTVCSPVDGCMYVTCPSHSENL